MATATTIKIYNYQDDKGNVDWKAYHEAKIKNGEICSNCNSVILVPKGQPNKCYSCKSVDDDLGEVSHSSRIRCPHCRYIQDPMDGDYYEIMEDGEHEVSCIECGKDFVISTYVDFTFYSPPVEQQ
jgi:DNA-directed RNA polymerase subunit RPC12/RpoP